MAIRTTHGAPKPYTLKSVKTDDGSLTQHAVVQCCECTRSYSFPWVHAENPTRIITHFERQGWTMYQNKARCAEHSIKRKQQQAAFARLATEKEQPMPEPRKTEPLPKTNVTNHPPIATYVMYVYQNGVVVIDPILNAQEMLLGDKTYMVIPR